MSIESHPFGGVKLTGEDARKFRDQVRHGRPRKAAVEALRRGIAMAEQIAQFGFVRLASGTLAEGGDAKQAPGESLSGPVAKPDAPTPTVSQ